MTTVLKLGGSVITEKDEPETVDGERLARAAADIGTAVGDGTVDRLVVVHGGGSFGHYHAQRHGVSGTDGSRDAAALSEIHAAMTDLNDAVLARLHGEGVGALPVRPFSVAHRDGEGDGDGGADGDGNGDGHRVLHLPTGSIEGMLDEGFVPVLHGDVVVERGKGATILSGDDLVVSLARSLDADRVGLCSSVPGVFDGSGAVISRIDAFEDVAEVLDASEATDVTGGMAGKVRALLGLSMPAHVFGPDDLDRFLAGAGPGTTIHGA